MGKTESRAFLVLAIGFSLACGYFAVKGHTPITDTYHLKSVPENLSKSGILHSQEEDDGDNNNDDG